MVQKAKILIVDDELPVCKSICSALADDFYTVDMALGGEEALRKEQENGYDIIITDLMMPGLNGMDLLNTLIKKKSGIKIIMITGYPSIQSAVQSMKSGAFDYIPKPFTPNELRSLVKRALESKRYHEERVVGQVRTEEGEIDEISIPGDCYCIPENSWAVREQNGNMRIGIHHLFIRTIEDIISIEFPKENETRYQGEACVRITDSKNHVHRVWTPVSGRVVAVNEEIERNHSILMKDPYKEGWILLMAPLHVEDDLKNLVLLKSS